MANLAASAVTILDSWNEAGAEGKRLLVLKVKLVLTGQGIITAASQIPASVFGMTIIDEATSFSGTTNTVPYVACPSSTGSCLLLAVGGGATFAVVTDTIYGIVKGS